jgi:4-amino-4-deoxy-L-arabinose transferase-like glycosyltransferase
MIPFVMRDEWWRSGLGGAIPSMFCFVAAGAFLFAAARRAYASAAAALAAVAIFAVNPNMLYLQSTPMTEPLFAASLMALLWATLWFRDSQSLWAIVAAGAASNAASLTRYEGWFLIPFAALYLLFTAKRKWHAVLFGAIAALAPLAWLAHNQFYYGNALEFYNGPWSAMAIYKRALNGGMQPYPGDRDWMLAAKYYMDAARLVVGMPLLAAGGIGLIAALWKRAWWPVCLLVLPPLFYIWSMHSSGVPVFVPDLWPHSYYNTRYATAVLPLAAFAAAAIVTMLPRKLSFAGAALLAIAGAAVWLAGPPTCWKESEVNSAARRDWGSQAAAYLAEHYQRGEGILFPFGDLTAVLRQAGIPLREGMHEGNGAAWNAAVSRPDLFLHEEWVIGYGGDDATTAALRADRRGRHYLLRKQIVTKGAPVVEIWQRQ